MTVSTRYKDPSCCPYQIERSHSVLLAMMRELINYLCKLFKEVIGESLSSFCVHKTKFITKHRHMNHASLSGGTRRNFNYITFVHKKTDYKILTGVVSFFHMKVFKPKKKPKLKVKKKEIPIGFFVSLYRNKK